MSLDYGFLRYMNTTNLLTVFVAYVKPWRIYYALPERSKGSDMPAIELLARWLQDMNLTNFVYRSDREAAIRSLMRDAAKMSRSEAHDVTDDKAENLLSDSDSDAESDGPESHPRAASSSTPAPSKPAIEEPPMPPPATPPDDTTQTDKKKDIRQATQKRDVLHEDRQKHA